MTSLAQQVFSHGMQPPAVCESADAMTNAIKNDWRDATLPMSKRVIAYLADNGECGIRAMSEAFGLKNSTVVAATCNTILSRDNSPLRRRKPDGPGYYTYFLVGELRPAVQPVEPVKTFAAQIQVVSSTHSEMLAEDDKRLARELIAARAEHDKDARAAQEVIDDVCHIRDELQKQLDAANDVIRGLRDKEADSTKLSEALHLSEPLFYLSSDGELVIECHEFIRSISKSDTVSLARLLGKSETAL